MNAAVPSLNELLSKMKYYLAPPGDGVYTVQTGSDKKTLLQKKIFGPKAVEQFQVKSIWEESLSKNIPKSKCVILGIPSDTGGGIQRGANFGPLYLRESLYLAASNLPAFDLGDIKVVPQLLHDKYLNQETIKKVRQFLYGSETTNLPVSPLSIAYDFATTFHQIFPHKPIFTIGGDHSISYPMARAYFEAKKLQGINTALIHFDAHTDLLDQRMGIDLCFGTWAYQILPFLKSPDHLIQIGIRSSRFDRHHWENNLGVTQYWASELEKNGPEAIAEKIVADLKKKGVEEIYISFDIDAIDETYAGATGTPEPFGLSPHVPMLIMQTLFDHFKISGSDIVEIAPLVKASHLLQIEPETTLLVAATFSNFLIEAMGAKA